MKRMLLCFGIAGLLAPSAGCFVHSSDKPGHTKKASSAKSGDCKPSQYWDGERCRHKGKGKGARKHDD